MILFVRHHDVSAATELAENREIPVRVATRVTGGPRFLVRLDTGPLARNGDRMRAVFAWYAETSGRAPAGGYPSGTLIRFAFE